MSEPIAANDAPPAAHQRPSWDAYFLAICEQISTRSPDPNTRHGCVLVDQGRRVLSTGYNGPVSGMPHELVPTTRPEKYAWYIHAEDNAVAFARCDLRGSTAYVTGTPCAACFRRLLQVGVRRIVQGDRSSACLTDIEISACRTMANYLGVEWVTLDHAVPGAQPRPAP
ncbi:MAG TPA: deaminase [Phycisphaerales bacterium]|nr:deaminase [Phycisphaerales bacterium]